MALIEDVIQWANTLPAWQADTIRRLLLTGEQQLSEEDYSEVLLLAKEELGLEQLPDKIKPIPPALGSFSGSSETEVSVKLLSIDDVKNVNIIKAGQKQPFAENGITVVYGDNGSGKSGYIRILKLACQARDKEEEILPDVFASEAPGIPSAKLIIKENETAKEIEWSQDSPPDPVLTNITVFDTRCARVITDKRNEFHYLPYGGDIFQKLAEVVVKIKNDIESELIELTPLQDSEIQAGTTGAIFLESLTKNTKDEEIEKATLWTPKEDKELVALEELAQKSSLHKATEEITRLEKIIGRIRSTSEGVKNIVTECQPLTNDTLKNLMTSLDVAKKAFEIASKEQQTPEPLPGVGTTSEWEVLYNAAKQYSENVAYPGEVFPKIDDALCVLCHQPLGEDAKARFGRFKNFMEDTTATVLAGKRSELVGMREHFQKITPLRAEALDSICDEIASHDINAAKDLRSFHNTIEKRVEAVLALLKEDEDHEEKIPLLPQWPKSVDKSLQVVIDSLQKKATEISNTAKPEEYKKLLVRIAELKSKRALNKRRQDIIDYTAKVKRNVNIQNAASSLNTNKITSQGTSIIRKNLTPELLTAFKEELSALNAEIPISLRTRGSVGEQAHEMQLEGANVPDRVKTSEILSEGETRAIAIAGFLAELRLANHANTIVMDDPASSLDHVFTAKIATRLVREGLNRQVVLFTHNIAFLMELMDAADVLAKEGSPVGINVSTLRRYGRSAGISIEGAPWYTMKVKQRVNYLEQAVHKIKSQYQKDMEYYNKEAAHIYGLLRESWESCIEDDLFYSVVCRYRNSVQTIKLTNVDINDEDIHLIDLNMSKASTWMTGHDKSKALHQDRPPPDEILSDIERLRLFSKEICGRRSKTEKRRKEQLEAN